MTTNRLLTQQQINEFIICNAKCKLLPNELIQIIVRHTLLEHVVYGRLKEAEEMIAVDPRLLLPQHSANVMTPAGLHLINVTPYECALGGRDRKMAEMIKCYFTRLENGDEQEKIQFEKYRLPLQEIITQQSYDFTALIDALIKSDNNDVNAELNYDQNYSSPLRIELEKFRKAFTHGTINEPGMHFNYLSLYQAYKLYDENFAKLYDGNDYDECKCLLFARQIVGFILRNLPACDRQIYAKGLMNSCAPRDDAWYRSHGYYISTKLSDAPRSFNLSKINDDNQISSYPISSPSDLKSHTGLGFDFYIDLDGECRSDLPSWLYIAAHRFGEYMSFINKEAELMESQSLPSQKLQR